MINKLQLIIDRYNELANLMSKPESMNNIKKFTQMAREHSSMDTLVEHAKKYLKDYKQLQEHEEILNGKDEELKELVKEKVKKIEKFNNEIISCNVILTKENNSENVEIIAHAKGHDFISSENEDIFERSLTNAVYKISNQIKKQHEKAIGR